MLSSASMKQWMRLYRIEINSLCIKFCLHCFLWMLLVLWHRCCLSFDSVLDCNGLQHFVQKRQSLLTVYLPFTIWNRQNLCTRSETIFFTAGKRWCNTPSIVKKKPYLPVCTQSQEKVKRCMTLHQKKNQQRNKNVHMLLHKQLNAARFCVL